MNYKAIIVDDEKELRTYLKKMLAETWPQLEICGDAANGKEALKMVDAFAPHIVFLDIKMPGLSGLDVAKNIAGICRIVFITAFDQYAVEAFEREAVDYLIKPVTKERLVQTINRLKKQLQSSPEPPTDLARIITEALGSFQGNTHANRYLQWIKTQRKDSIRLVPVEEIDYFQAGDKYTLLKTAQGEALIKKSIKELTQELDPQKFWQIHRGTIVNVSRIENVGRSLTGRGVLKLKNRSDTFTVSRQYLHLFKQM
ncbi:two component transcriptional regulator, LytTR family [Smithella sp. ME-1]|uniref:Response regulator n=1 Tax=hydrocarbon metagenome TaxID=938273 RepID=A0A0W8FML3_9ZZZZ|nr:two component transcriptional regulator, LytTR family [Smithella sp. ME-1]